MPDREKKEEKQGGLPSRGKEGSQRDRQELGRDAQRTGRGREGGFRRGRGPGQPSRSEGEGRAGQGRRTGSESNRESKDR